MDLIERFKNYCRDRGKYNVETLSEIMQLFHEFEKEEAAKEEKVTEKIPEETASQAEKTADYGTVIPLTYQIIQEG